MGRSIDSDECRLMAVGRRSGAGFEIVGDGSPAIKHGVGDQVAPGAAVEGLGWVCPGRRQAALSAAETR